jgi:hypothetical protein
VDIVTLSEVMGNGRAAERSECLRVSLVLYALFLTRHGFLRNSTNTLTDYSLNIDWLFEFNPGAESLYSWKQDRHVGHILVRSKLDISHQE